MKYLLPLILSGLLLCGCGNRSPESPVPPLPTEPVVGETRSMEEYRGAVQTTALNLKKVRGMVLFGEHILLLSGQETTTLTLLEPNSLEEQASVTLNCFLTEADLTCSPEGTLSFYEPQAAAVLVLDRSLREIRRSLVPGLPQEPPVFWGDTVFYCTASEIRAWNLTSGIRRRVKEMACDSQRITGVLMDGAVLQCLVTQDGQIRTLFLSAADGRLLHDVPGACAIHTHSSGFSGTLSPGGYPLHIFGETSPQLLIPRDFHAACWFLPEQKAAVTAGDGLLDYYDLTAGLRRCTLSLDPYQTVKAAVPLGEDKVMILSYDPAMDMDTLLLWDVRPGNPTWTEDNTAYVQSYHKASAPDAAGLEDCTAAARALGAAYGLTIRVWKDAVKTAPGDHALEPEHLVPFIQAELALLNQRLGQYPEGILAQTAAHFTSVNLCLVRSAAAEGCPAFFLDGTDAYVVIPMGAGAEQALSHGLFHAMEVHIFSKSHAFDQWNDRNPAGFQYDYDYAANALRDSGIYLFQEHRVFVDTFSMSFPTEDRARIFEYALLENREDLFLPKDMQKKLQTLCTGIREAYGLEENESVFPWEAYLQ